MLQRIVALCCVLCCTSVLARPEQLPEHPDITTNEVTFGSSSFKSGDTALLGPNSHLRLQNNSALSWKIELMEDLQSDGVSLTLGVKQLVSDKWVPVLDLNDVPLCAPPKPEMMPYVTLLGLDKSTPPAACPFKAGTYSLEQFKPTATQVEGIPHGKTSVNYIFKYNGKVVGNTTLTIQM